MPCRTEMEETVTMTTLDRDDRVITTAECVRVLLIALVLLLWTCAALWLLVGLAEGRTAGTLVAAPKHSFFFPVTIRQGSGEPEPLMAYEATLTLSPASLLRFHRISTELRNCGEVWNTLDGGRVRLAFVCNAPLRVTEASLTVVLEAGLVPGTGTVAFDFCRWNDRPAPCPDPVTVIVTPAAKRGGW